MYSPTTIKPVIEKCKQEKKKIVLVGGCFDILHLGHITFLEKAKQQGDILIVLLESDERIKKIKGLQRPFHTQQQRAHMLSNLRSVDFVVGLPTTMEDADYDSLVTRIHPNILATTENDPFMQHKQRQARSIGAHVVTVTKRIPHLSTSNFIKILSREL